MCHSTKLCKPFRTTVHTLTFHIALWNASSTTLTYGRQRISLGLFPGPTENFVYSMMLKDTLALTGNLASFVPISPCSTVSSIPMFVLYVWCVVVATAIFMDRCSCRQEVRRRHSQRRFAESLSTNDKKGAIHETSCGIQIFGPNALSDGA